MLKREELVPYLRKSLSLQDPNIENDPAYVFTDDDLYAVLKMAVIEHNPRYTELNFPENEQYFLVLLAKKEIYYRLASSSAPFYPLQAEGAGLRKDYRFEHYMSLIRIVNNEYKDKYDKFIRDIPVEQGELFVPSRHFTGRTYSLMETPVVELEVVAVRSDSADLKWKQFDVLGGMFWKYEIYVSESPIYDEFEDLIDSGATKVVEITDIRRTKYRLKDLVPETHYYILVVAKDLNGIKGYSEVEIDTLP